MTGPMPQVTFPPVGEKKNEARTSPMPEAGTPPAARLGWPMNGTITRVIMFQSLFSENGMTGWTLRMKRVPSSGPTPCAQLN